MQMFIAFLFAALVAVSLAETSDDVCINWGPKFKAGVDTCEPGQSFFSECNSCSCLRDGKNAVCTLQECTGFRKTCQKAFEEKICKNFAPLFKNGVDTCEPGKRFYSECNSCACSNDGKSAACTYMDCRLQRAICTKN